MRVFGVDPGLTRCGVGIVDVAARRVVSLVDVTVVRTQPDMPLERRLLAIGTAVEELLDEHRPDAVAVERVFAQHNVRTVMGTAQISGVVLNAAAARGLAVGLHTPSEVKAAITGYGSADKKQVATMVARILGLASPPRPADAADALALAVCHGWRDPAADLRSGVGASASPTPAQRAWLAAEASARTPDGHRRLSR